jgi:hypothetical protein
VDQGIITPGKAKRHPQGHIIARNLGSSPEVEVDIPPDGPFRIRDGDVFLLCSDGLYGLVDDEAIRQVIRAAPPKDATQGLISLANRKGGHDNITVCTVCAGHGQKLWDVQNPEVLTSLLDRLALDQTSDTAVFNVSSRDALQPTDFETQRMAVPDGAKDKLERDIREREKALAEAIGKPKTGGVAPVKRAESPVEGAPRPSSSLSRAQPEASPAATSPEAPAGKGFPWFLVVLFVGLLVAILFVVLGIVYLAFARDLVKVDSPDNGRPAKVAVAKASKIARKRPARTNPVRQPKIPDRQTQVSCSTLADIDEDLTHYKLTVADGQGGQILVHLGMDDAAGQPVSCRATPGSMVKLPRDQALLHFWYEDSAGKIRDCHAEYADSEPVMVDIRCVGKVADDE